MDILEDIAHHFSDLNLRWLITGEGAMLAEPAALPETAASKDDARLLVLHTAGNDQYIILQSNSAELVKVSRVTLTHSEREMEKSFRTVPAR